jgi:sugar phosphate isomerase/epimerase
MKLGMVTYLWGADWDLPTILRNCRDTGFAGVELRTTHKHGVEPTLSKEQRSDIRKQFADSGVTFVGPGSACEYHSADHGVVQQNIDDTKRFVELSADCGGSGVKVRPNGFVKGEDRDATIQRIGEALRTCGEFAAQHNQEIRVEVHGNGTSDLGVMRKIMLAADHPAVRVCWNSNPGETINGSLEVALNQVLEFMGATIHVHDLYDPAYPYRELFSRLQAAKWDGWCLSESPATTDPIRVMRYYKALWFELLHPLC